MSLCKSGCTVNGYAICLECEEDSFLDGDGMCNKCSNGCKSCSDQVHCNECKTTYGLDNDDECHLC
jgi:hypothetical protein